VARVDLTIRPEAAQLRKNKKLDRQTALWASLKLKAFPGSGKLKTAAFPGLSSLRSRSAPTHHLASWTLNRFAKAQTFGRRWNKTIRSCGWVVPGVGLRITPYRCSSSVRASPERASSVTSAFVVRNVEADRRPLGSRPKAKRLDISSG